MFVCQKQQKNNVINIVTSVESHQYRIFSIKKSTKFLPKVLRFSHFHLKKEVAYLHFFVRKTSQKNAITNQIIKNFRQL